MKLYIRASRRRAFTLVELLVVIAIIAVLMGLISVAIFQYLAKGPEAEVRNEISQLSNALGDFYQRFGTYPPSRVFLANSQAAYVSADQQESLQILHQLFPRLVWTGINWGPVGNGVWLEGDQCLVFFLGGMQTNVGGVNGCLGFSTNPKNPTQPAAGTDKRIGPFYNFESGRLVPAAGGFFHYIDKFNKSKPYAYFSSGKRRNGYKLDLTTTGAPIAGSSHCARLGVMPYVEALATVTPATPTRFHHPDSFQIVSAGADGAFGPGGQWTTATAPALQKPGGADDMTNFHGRLMGIP